VVILLFLGRHVLSHSLEAAMAKMTTGKVEINSEILHIVPVTMTGGAVQYALGRKRAGGRAGFDPAWVITPKPSQLFWEELAELLPQD
jgi:hypothetical protein